MEKDIEEKFNASRQDAAKITIPKRLHRPHPIIAGWIEDRARQNKEAREERDPRIRRLMQASTLTDADQRRHRILDALFKTLERHLFKVKTGERREVYFEIDRERVDFDLREKQRQVRRSLTDEEKRRSFNPERPWRQELQPTGALLFLLKTHLGPGLKHEWTDKPDNKARWRHYSKDYLRRWLREARRSCSRFVIIKAIIRKNHLQRFAVVAKVPIWRPML
jgi:hypothetical protein